jgi:hypothetical protein
MADESQMGIEVKGNGTVAGLLALIPDPDGVAFQAATAGNLDEMFPSTASALRKELQDIIDNTGGSRAGGIYTVTAADDTANQADIVTGITGLVLADKLAVSLWRAGVNIPIPAAAISEPVDGTLRIADSGALVVTEDDLIVWTILT